MSKIDKESLVKEIERLKDGYNQASSGLMSESLASMMKVEALNKVLAIISSMPDETASEDLDKAARLYSIPHYTRDIDKEHLDEYSYDTGLEAAFKAGAKWQEEKEKEYSPWLTIPRLKEAALEFGEQAKAYEIGGQSFTEDMAVAFTRGAEWEKEQMMKGAVSCSAAVCKLTDRVWITPKDEKQFHTDVYDNFIAGQKVKLIVIPED